MVSPFHVGDSCASMIPFINGFLRDPPILRDVWADVLSHDYAFLFSVSGGHVIADKKTGGKCVSV